MPLHVAHLQEYYRDPSLPLAIKPAIHSGSGVEHSHDFYELVYVRRGGGIHIIHGRPYPIIAGDVYVMQPGVVHTYNVDREAVHIFNVLFVQSLFHASDWEYLNVLPGIAPFLTADKKICHKITVRPPHDHVVEALCVRIGRELERAESGFELLCRALMLELLLTLNRLAVTYQGGEGPAPGPIGSTIAYLHEHLAEPISMEDLALETQLSANYLGEIFHAEIGQTVTEYLNRLRVDRARDLLDRTDKSVTDIALSTGFDSISYFGKTFRRLTGYSPREYRMLANTTAKYDQQPPRL